ncbi:MAG: type II toxin-antitoxin system RelE/ParE family toxin [Gemmatales bacterium]
MIPNILRAEQAEDDLLGIFVYIGKDNLRVANRFMDAAEAAVQRLAQLPGLGRVWSSTSPKLKGIRCWPVPRFSKYVIFYRPLGDGIELLRVLHSKRNIVELLDDL